MGGYTRSGSAFHSVENSRTQSQRPDHLHNFHPRFQVGHSIKEGRTATIVQVLDGLNSSGFEN